MKLKLAGLSTNESLYCWAVLKIWLKALDCALEILECTLSERCEYWCFVYWWLMSKLLCPGCQPTWVMISAAACRPGSWSQRSSASRPPTGGRSRHPVSSAYKLQVDRSSESGTRYYINIFCTLMYKCNHKYNVFMFSAASGGPINVFFKLPITEVSSVDDHTRVNNR